MNSLMLKKLFPGISEDCIAANTESLTTVNSAQLRALPAQSMIEHYQQVADTRGQPHVGKLVITVSGQVKGGKNNMTVTRNGLHFPKKEWAKWRDEKVAEVKTQLPKGWTPLIVPVQVQLDYVAGDCRRRDQPAIIDALWHVLEKAGVVEDDTNLWVCQSSREYDKEIPRTQLTLTW